MNGRVQLADFRSLARFAARSRRAQLFLVLAALAAAALAVFLTPHRPTSSGTILRPGSSAIVVVDLSASISTDTYARIASTLAELQREGGRAGLILFSDTAYQALPPGSPVRELAPFQRFFVIPPQTRPGVAPTPPASPWTSSFSAGTRISTGLSLALDVIRGQALPRPLVILVSDLDDDTGDLESLTSVALAYRHLGIPIKVVGLNPSPEDTRIVERLIPPGGSLVTARLPGERRGAFAPTFPTATVVLTVVLALVLAAFLAATERLRWTGA